MTGRNGDHDRGHDEQFDITTDQRADFAEQLRLAVRYERFLLLRGIISLMVVAAVAWLHELWVS